jgi:hypothetical protein
LHKTVAEGLDKIEVDLDDYRLPEPDLPPENDGQLYDSERDYIEQMGRYKAYRYGGNNE